MHYQISALTLLAAVGLASAQTFTDCNPLEKTCPADTGLSSSTFSSNFLQGKSAFSGWSAADGTSIKYGSQGAEFTISEDGQAPTIQTDFYVFFGTIEVKMQAAPGTGIVSSIVLESDDLDEIDWEFLGGDTTQVESNYFGKGNTATYDRAIYHPVSTPQTTVHTYTVDWSKSAIVFSVDGTVVRTLTAAAAGDQFPQTPMRLKLGNWAGGAAGQPAGTVEWAGGATDFSKAPFTMYVESVSIKTTNPAKEYIYGDKTGSWQSIKIVTDNNAQKAVSGDSSSASTAATVSTSTASKSAPTSSHSVAALQQTAAAVQTTVTGTASNSDSHTKSVSDAGKTSTMRTQLQTGASVRATSLPTSGAYSAKGSSNSSSSANSSSTKTSSSLPVQQTTSGASANTATAAIFTIFTFAMCFWML